MLPQDPDAEQAVLGGFLLDSSALYQPGFPRLTPAAFYAERHQRIFASILSLHAAGQVPDVVTVPAFLQDHGDLKDGDRIYILSLPNACPSLAAVSTYAARVVELAARRHEIERAWGAAERKVRRIASGEGSAKRSSPNGDTPPAAPGFAAEAGPLLPLVIVSNRPLRDQSGDALAALAAANDPPTLFQRGGLLARVRRDERGAALIEPLSEHALRGRLARAATFLRVCPDGSPCHVAPPLDLTRDVASLGEWPGVPPLAGIVEAPVLRPDGTILDAPGYDVVTGLFYAPASGLVVLPIPEHPTTGDVVRARVLLDEALDGFPFDGTASRAHVMALLITLPARPAIAGPVPLFLLDKPTPGTGASLLCEVVARIVTGRPAAMMSPPKDDEEARKGVTAALLSGSLFNILDNADRVLASSSLSRMLTANVWRDRILGRSEQISLAQRAVWAATGNNLRIAGDLARRSVLIRLDARVPRPWERRAFRHPDLLAWVFAHRGDLLAAILTICRAWFAAGQPDADVPMMGGFEGWARLVGGILAHAGVPGFLADRSRLYEQVDEEHAGWPAFLEALRAEFGDETFTSQDLVRRLEQGGPLRGALPERFLDGHEVTVRRLGEAFKRRMDVRFRVDGLRVERVSSGRNGASWRVVVDEPQAPALEDGTDPESRQGPLAESVAPDPAPEQADLADAVDRLAGAGDGRLKYVLDLGRSLGFPELPFAPGRAVVAGEVAWVKFASRAPAGDVDLVLAALQALSDAPAEETR